MKDLILIMAMCIVFLVLLYAYLKWINNQIEVVCYEITTDRIRDKSEPIKMVLVTDLHNHEFGRENERLIQIVKKQKPDLILIAGDMFVKAPDFKEKAALHVVKELTKICPVFYGNGNHEKKVSEFWEESKDAFFRYQQELQKAGVHYLVNDSLSVTIKGSRLFITGLDLELVHYGKIWNREALSVEELGDKIQPDRLGGYNILIAHNPQYFKLYAKWGADLVVSGHVHGGIMILPWLGGVIAPNYRLFPKYDFGLFRENKCTMVLSRGLGVHTFKFRFFNKPEVSVINLKGK